MYVCHTDIPFILREELVEQESRLSFSPDDPNDVAFEGMLMFSGVRPDIIITNTIEVYASVSASKLQHAVSCTVCVCIVILLA